MKEDEPPLGWPARSGDGTRVCTRAASFDAYELKTLRHRKCAIRHLGQLTCPRAVGYGRTWYTVTLARIDQTDAGTWARSDSFRRADLPHVAKVADLCHNWMDQQTKEENG